ncbi:DoxX-like family protein [Aestuariibaculum sediminum]|uniref:DoxX-like family protein n=1 Tax=Aestuariibaculum sediminum TaxID=2770637 RepID=A0A8J6U6P5_9FLAO|nr:DoxX-like family protein [Aestuariibaculum sediminum]MBD0830728.1 hypothetical protein [Aestuariibaculum sediminum]
MNYKKINIIIACIWFINGLFCKMLNLVPRHQQIVASILAEDKSRLITIIIGFLEICMALWMVSNKSPKLNAIFQIIIISIMNTLEVLTIPELLLYGKLNIFFALILVTIIYLNNIHSNKVSHGNIKS